MEGTYSPHWHAIMLGFCVDAPEKQLELPIILSKTPDIKSFFGEIFLYIILQGSSRESKLSAER